MLSCEPDDVLEWHDGPVVAVARCRDCAGRALLELLDWSRSRRVRVFTLAALEADAVALFQRNRARGSCDLGRAERELEALLFSAGPVERVVALDVESHAVVATAPRADLRLPGGPWHERVLTEDEPLWFARLGLSKAEL